MRRSVDRVAKACASGAAGTVPLRCMRRKTGLSVSRNLSRTDTASGRIESRKGIRQPHAAKASSPSALRSPRISSSVTTKAAVMVPCRKLV